MYVAAWKERERVCVRKNVWNNNEMFHILSNAVNMNLYRPIILSPNFCQKKKKKKKRGRGALFSKEKGCYVLVIQEFISFTCQLIYISLILETKKVECPRNPWLVQDWRGQPVVINMPSIFQDQMTNTSLLVYQFQVLIVFLQSLPTTTVNNLP